MNQRKLTDLTVENILFTGKSVKMQITDLISEYLTDLDLESRVSKRRYVHSGHDIASQHHLIFIILQNNKMTGV